MQYLNAKTNTVFNARTTKDFDGFVAIVSRYERSIPSESLIHRSKHSTRSKAYITAKKEALYAFLKHCTVFGS